MTKEEEFYYNRERVRQVVEKTVIAFQPLVIKTIAHQLKLNTRTVSKHLKAIAREQSLPAVNSIERLDTR